MLTVGPEPDKFSVKQTADFDTPKVFACITKFKGEFCFVLGGCDDVMSSTGSNRGNTLASVSHYNIVKNKWEQGTPAL